MPDRRHPVWMLLPASLAAAGVGHLFGVWWLAAVGATGFGLSILWLTVLAVWGGSR